MDTTTVKKLRSLLNELENLDKFIEKREWRDTRGVKIVFSAETHEKAEEENREPIYFNSLMVAIIREEAIKRRKVIEEQLDKIDHLPF